MRDELHSEWQKWRRTGHRLIAIKEISHKPLSLCLVSTARKLMDLNSQIGQLQRTTTGHLQQAAGSLDSLVSNLISHFDSLMNPFLRLKLHDSIQRNFVIKEYDKVNWAEMYALLSSVIESISSSPVARQAGTLQAVSRLQARREICLRIPDWLVTLTDESVSPDLVNRFSSEIEAAIGSHCENT